MRCSCRKALLFFLVLALVACSRSLPPEELLQRAELALEQGRLNAAVIDIKSALQQLPSDDRGRRLLGEVYLHQRLFAEAAAEFERSLGTAADPAVAALYAEALNSSGQPQKVIDLHSEGFFDFALLEPAFVAVLAKSQILLGDTFEAEDTLAQARALDATHPEVRLAEAIFAVNHQRDLERGAQILGLLTEEHPEFDEAWSFYGALLARQGDLVAAESAYGRAAAINPARMSDRLMRVNLLLELNWFEDADAELRLLEERIPSHPGLHYARGRLLFIQDQPAAALEALQKVLAVAPDHVPSLYLAGAANFNQGNLATAERQLSRFVAAQPSHLNGRQLLAGVLLQLNEPKRSATIARGILEEQPMNLPTMNILALALAAQGMHAASAEIFEDIAAQAPDYAVTRMQLGTELMRAGETARGIAELQAALVLEPASSDIRGRLVQAHLVQGEDDEALALAREGLEQSPDDLKALLNLAAVHARRGEVQAMLEVLDRGMDAHPDALEPRLVMARYHARHGGQPGDALDLLNDVPEAQRDDPRVLEVMVYAYLRIGEPGAALESARKLNAQLPDSVVALRLLALAERANDNPAASEQHLRRALELQPEDFESRKLLVEALLIQNKLREADEAVQAFPPGALPEAQVNLTRGRIAATLGDVETGERLLRQAWAQAPASNTARLLASVLWAQPGKRNEAIELLEGWLARAPEDAAVQQQLGSYHVLEGNDARALPLFEALLERRPDDVVAMNNIAWMVRKSDPERALTLGRAALVAAPDSPAVQDTVAMVLLEQGEHGEALALNERALAAAPQSPDMRFHRAQILVAAGDVPAAIEILQDLASGPDFAGKAEAGAFLAGLQAGSR